MEDLTHDEIEIIGYLRGNCVLRAAAKLVRAGGLADKLEALAAASRLIDSDGSEPALLALTFRQAPESVSCSFTGVDSPFPTFLFWCGLDAVRVAVVDCGNKCMEPSGVIADSGKCILDAEAIARVMKVMEPIVGNNADNLGKWLELVLQGMQELRSISV